MESKKFAGSIGEGEPIYCEDGILYVGCCDCGLVHMIIATPITNNDVELRFFRDNKRTSNRRKYGEYPYLSKKTKKSRG